MRGSRRVRGVVFIAAMAAFVVAARPACGQTRRAVLVGINDYADPQSPDGRSQPTHAPGRSRDAFTNLQGAVNDVEALRQVLITRFGFRPGDVHVLEDRAATREAILAAIRQWLIEAAAPGDVSFFYYAGHGSQVRNSKSFEPDKLDESVVPVDAPAGAPDIRDKEIARLFGEALDRHVRVTVGFDSCHSGSISRGQLVPIRVRSVVADPRDAADPSNPPSLESKGAIVLAAAQSHQLAGETVDEDGNPHGLFTWALLKVLRSMPANEPVARLFLSLEGLVRSVDATQDPDLETTADRKSEGLFGAGDSSGGQTIVAVESVARTGEVTLAGGIASGVRTGTELRTFETTPEHVVSVRVAASSGLDRSRAELIGGRLDDVTPGALFEVVRWASGDGPMLRVWTGRGTLSANRVDDAVKRLSAAVGPEVVWTDDPLPDDGASAPTSIVQWEGASWALSRSGRMTTLSGLASDEIARVVRAGNAGQTRLFVDVPLPRELAGELRLGAGSANEAVEVEASPERADYILVGRRGAAALEYAWMRPAVGGDVRASTLPVVTNWVSLDPKQPAAAARSLETLAGQLGVIKGWLQLESPPGAQTIPYHLGLRDLVTRTVVTGESIRAGNYDLLLTKDGDAVTWHGAPEYVYVFVIDSSGKRCLLFPSVGAGGGENHLPPRDETGQWPDEIRLGGIKVESPFGVDTYVLLTTATPLSDPHVLEGAAVVTPGSRGAATDALSALIARVGAVTRGTGVTTPADWAIERLTITSVAASK